MSEAYQENGKWYKECSKTKEVFGPVDNKQDLSQWFSHTKTRNIDGFNCICKQCHKQYRQKNKNILSEKKKEYCQKNKEKIIEYRNSASGMFSNYKNKAKQRKINFTLTIEWFEEQVKKPEFNFCAISGIEFINGSNGLADPFSRSLDRISSTKGYTPDNVRWVCFKYNSWKCDLTLEDIARIFKYTAQSHNLDPHEILNQVS